MKPVTPADVQKLYLELTEGYTQFRPILATLQEKNGGDLIPAIKNEIRAINDHIARCYITDATPDQQFHELVKADGHLRRAIYDTFKQLNILYHDFIREYDDRHFGNHWHKIDNGAFWEQYATQRLEVDKWIHEAKQAESENKDETQTYYTNAYIAQSEVYRLIRLHKKELELTWCDKLEHWFRSHRAWVLWTVFGALVSAIVCKAVTG